MRNSLYRGKIVVIIGSTQGLGEAIARKMVVEQAAGASISGCNVERGKALAEELTGLGTPTIFVRTELENLDECWNLIRQSVERFGRLDGLANSAGITTRGTLEESSVELWDQHMAVNARTPFLTMQEAVIYYAKTRMGRFDCQYHHQIRTRRVTVFDSIFVLKRSIGNAYKKCGI
jgi:NAD(P)-dependent dehydrogenase (short-subunit alcohol dehydrogenase family)